MSEHHMQSKMVPADPADPDHDEIERQAEALRQQYPVPEGYERVETLEWLERTVLIENVDGGAAHVVTHRTPSAGGTIRPTQPQPEPEGE